MPKEKPKSKPGNSKSTATKSSISKKEAKRNSRLEKAASKQYPTRQASEFPHTGSRMGQVPGGGGKKRSGKKRKASAKFLAAGNAWRAHVKETMRKNPNMKFGKELLRLAKKTYKKGSSSSHGTVKIATSKYSVQVRPKTKRAKTKRAKTKRAKARKTKRAKKRTSRKSSRLGFFGF